MKTSRHRSFLLLVTCVACLPVFFLQVPARAAQQKPPLVVPITITLTGPNQFTSSPQDFGPAWDHAVATFEKLNPGVTFKTTVLPAGAPGATVLNTIIAAGNATDLVFNQATYKPYQVVPLDRYLAQPNPYAPQRKHWLDWFKGSAFGYNIPGQVDTNGHLDWIPFNLINIGVFVNEDAFRKAGVTWPIKTWTDFIVDCKKLKAAGYIPFAMDSDPNWPSWTFWTILNMVGADRFGQFNYYLPNGKRGKSTTLNAEDIARAVRLKLWSPYAREFTESLKLMKELYDNYVTPDWSGIASGGAFRQFVNGQAAIMWGSNGSVSALQGAGAKFKFTAIAFPTITKATTPLSINWPAQSGAGAGGTSYMIPATTKGLHRFYAVRFLQFMTAPKYNQPWTTATTSISAIKAVKSPPSVAFLATGAWAATQRNDGPDLMGFYRNSDDLTNIMQGYLLGTASLRQTQDALNARWQDGVKFAISQNPPWQHEPWAK